ncbi:MAG TPA: hypothetical protein VNL98_05245 [Gemmatimonadales bacterium]|nr:hypothetical protein [Gemmatimonadales bacterium]
MAVAAPAFDNRLKDDPEYTGYTPRVISGRMQEAYLHLGGSQGDVHWGRYARQWGPALFDGLLISPTAYSTETIGATLRVWRLRLESFTGRLSDSDSLAAVPVQRWLIAHRLAADLGRGVWLALVETGVYGGRGAGFDPVLSAPFNLALLSDFNDSPGGTGFNGFLGADLSVPLSRSVRVEAGGFLDDIQVDDDTLTDRRPASYGLSVSATRSFARAPLLISLGYTRVSALAYRNSFNPELRWAQRDVGLGRNFSDYDQVLLRAEWRPAQTWSTVLDLSYIRQGAGDFRQIFPPDSVLAQPGQGFLIRPVHRMPGVRITVVGAPRPGVEIGAELGATRDGAGRSELVAGVRLNLRADLLRQRWGAALPALLPSTDRGWP